MPNFYCLQKWVYCLDNSVHENNEMRQTHLNEMHLFHLANACFSLHVIIFTLQLACDLEFQLYSFLHLFGTIVLLWIIKSIYSIHNINMDCLCVAKTTTHPTVGHKIHIG